MPWNLINIYNKDLLAILKEFITEGKKIKRDNMLISKHTSSELLNVIIMLLVHFLSTILKLI